MGPDRWDVPKTPLLIPWRLQGKRLDEFASRLVVEKNPADRQPRPVISFIMPA